MPTPTSFNLSELFEQVVDAVPDRTAVVTVERTLTYRALDERASRLAHFLASRGIGAGDHVGLQLMNGTEYLEGMLAAFKLRAVPVNINYRYVEQELEHLYENADLVGLVFHRQLGARVAAAVGRLPRLRALLVVEDGSDAAVPDGADEYEASLAAGSPARDFTGRTSDDVYIAYTGGTTGLPKGVVWRHEDIFFASMGGGDPMQVEGPIASPDELPGRITEMAVTQLITPPLMHVSAHWNAFTVLFGGGTIVLPPPGSFDPDAVLDLATRHGANVITLVGDAMVRPLLDAYERRRDEVDLSALFVVASGGALLSSATKDRIRALLPGVIVVDGFGSTETGVAGAHSSVPGGERVEGARFRMDATTTVLDDDLRPVAPGSGVVGRLARRGRIPIGYYRDPEKTAATFVERDGVRWVLPGDLASVEADGTIVLHGRGSLSINTGGEKVFPEEVEARLLAHPAVHDAVVVGVPDDRWGEQVVAVVQPRPGATLDADDVRAFCRAELAGYKVPRRVVVVDAVQRNPNGKADYEWARARACS